MLEPPKLNLQIVTGEDLREELCERLRPGEEVEDAQEIPRRLPTHYFRVPSWKAALEIELAPHFGLWELIDVDVREAPSMRSFPRYIPCAITVLAAHLAILRIEVGRVIRIAANGGYRSPAHQLSKTASPHSWGTAANIYRIGDDLLDTRERVERYAQIARSILPGAYTRPWGQRPGYAFDHLHIDLGYVLVYPHGEKALESGRESAEEG
ncbi:MAG: hypothetical protein GEU90_09340 [Gemmatimonas sp.]|nr:hypothetical protein [Gemmatimonas sp.]